MGDFAYVSTKTNRRSLRGKLKYLQYRDDRHGHIPQRGGRRWEDRGLGHTYRGIQAACERLQSKHVLAWTWVISPAPDLMALVPEDLRRDLLIDLTERVVEAYYEARGADVPEYSFVLHERQTNETGQQQLHTHAILPGTIGTAAGREPFYNNKEKGHDRLIREVATAQFETALDTLVGPHWRDLRPELAPTRLDSDNLDDWFPRER